MRFVHTASQADWPVLETPDALLDADRGIKGEYVTPLDDIIQSYTIRLHAIEGYRIRVNDGLRSIEKTLGWIEGVAVADAEKGPYKVSGMSSRFHGRLGELHVEDSLLVVYPGRMERYLWNFFNPVVANEVIDKARKNGYSMHNLPIAAVEMPASFALKTQTQRELASGVQAWLTGNIEALVKALLEKPEHGRISRWDKLAIPLYLRSLFHSTAAECPLLHYSLRFTSFSGGDAGACR